MNIKIIKNQSNIEITNGANDGIMKSYFSRKFVDYSRGRDKATEVKIPLYVEEGTSLFVPTTIFRMYNIDDVDPDEDTSIEVVRDAEIDKDILKDPYKLRQYQVDVVNKMCKYERAGAQIATGAGKTLIIGGICKHPLYDGKTTLIIVPSSHLYQETGERLSAYGLDVSYYGDTREIQEGKVNITMYQSLVNDINSKGSKILDPIKLLIIDESHHADSESYYRITTLCRNLIGLYGLSGSLFNEELSKYNFSNIDSFSPDESRLALTLGSCPVEITYDDLVKMGFLTDCMYVQINTNIKSGKSNSFTSVAPETIESDERLDLLAKAIEDAKELGYSKFMCYTRVKEAGERFLRKLEVRGIDALLVYGGKQNGYLNKETDKIEFVGDNALFEDFKSGKYEVMIGTTAVEEGVDIPSCDCVVFLAGGKSIRQVLQRAGRGFRLSEGKEYALIIDTNDKGHTMTKQHSKERANICRTRLRRNPIIVNSLLDLK